LAPLASVFWSGAVFSLLTRDARTDVRSHAFQASWSSLPRLLRGIVLVVIAGGTGFGLNAALRSDPFDYDTATLASPHAGACVALELAMAHGFLDETKKRIVMRTLVDPRNPYADRFGTSHAGLSRTCALVIERRWAP
jgi:hypothetical protein